MAVHMSHVGMAVSDLQTSTRFYVEGLGFELGMSFDSGDEVAAVAEVTPPMRMKAQNLEKDGFRIQLMDWEAPGVTGTPSVARNQRGLTHLAIVVDELDETVSRLVELGGTALEDTRVQLEKGPMKISLAVVADPDGSRIELLQRG